MTRFSKLLQVLLCSLCCATGNAATLFDSSGTALSRAQLIAAINAADVVVIGEIHTDVSGHAWQQELLRELVRENISFSLSLEEFDRSQQASLDDYSAGRIDGDELKRIRAFVGPSVRDNWHEWYLPKLQIARDANVDMIASNAPLKYSRMARNAGCENLTELSAAEDALFDCPLLPLDPAYQARFYKTMSRISRKNQSMGLKPLGEPQMAKMFHAHRVWDATMAQSIVNAHESDSGRVVHLVGCFHTDFNGGLLQELRARAGDVDILVISIRPRRSASLAAGDASRADIMVYRNE